MPARQHRCVHVGAVIEEITLQGERTHAVAQHDERNARMLTASDRAELAEIAHRTGPTTGTEIAVVMSRSGGRAVAAMVVGLDDVAGRGEGFGQSPVPSACSPIPCAICMIAFGALSPLQR